MTGEPKERRWLRPRYSLATLFVVVTVVGVWLGVQVHTVRQRAEVRSMLLLRGVYCLEFKKARTVGPNLWIRNRIFGDVIIDYIHLPLDEFTEQEEEGVRQSFPEAKVFRGYGRWVP